MKMVDISRKTYEINVMETKIDNDGVLQLNVKHIEEGLDLRQIKTNYNSNHRKHRCDLVEKPKKKVNRISIDEKLVIKVIMDCRTTMAHKVRTRLGFKQYDIILTRERSVVTKIMSSFEEENMQTQYKVLSYRIDLYFYEINENGHIDRNIDYEIKRQKEIEQELGCKFIKIDPDKEDFDIFKAVNEIFRHIKQSTKKTQRSKI